MSFIRSGSPASPSLRQLEGVSPFWQPASWLVCTVRCCAVLCRAGGGAQASSTCVPAPLLCGLLLSLPGLAAPSASFHVHSSSLGGERSPPPIPSQFYSCPEVQSFRVGVSGVGAWRKCSLLLLSLLLIRVNWPLSWCLHVWYTVLSRCCLHVWYSMLGFPLSPVKR